MTSVTVALIGDPTRLWEGYNGSPIPGDGVPYDNLPKVPVEATDDESLIQILRRAADELGVEVADGREFAPSVIAFYQPGDDQGYPSDRHEKHAVELVDELGRVMWEISFTNPRVTVPALLNSYEAGALDGDPRRPYLILRAVGGNGILANWDQYVLALFVLREILGTLGDAYSAGQAVRGAGQWIKTVVSRFRHTPEVVAEKADAWQQRGGWPDGVEAFLLRQPWRLDVLSSLLDCTTEDAVALLSGLGFQHRPDTDMWHPIGDQEARVMRYIASTVHSVDWEMDYQSEVEFPPLAGHGCYAARVLVV